MGMIIAVEGLARTRRFPRYAPWLLLMASLFAHAALASTNSEILRSKAIFAYVDRGYDQALLLLDQALADDADDHIARYYRGLCQARLGNYAPALSDLEQSYLAGVRRDGLLYELGMVNYHMGDYPESGMWLQRSLAQRPDHRLSAYYLGVAEYRMQHYPQTLAALDKVDGGGSDLVAAATYLRAESLYHLGRKTEGRQLLQQLLQREESTRFFDYHLYPYSSLWQGDGAEARRSRALFSAAGMDLDTSRQLLDEALQDNGDDRYARYYLGVVQARQGDYAGAQRDLSQAAAAGFHHRELAHEMGYVAYRQGDYASAVQWLERGVAETPRHDRSNYFLGLSLQQLKEYPRALAALEQVNSAGEYGNEASYVRAEILVQLRRDDEALAILQRLMDDPGQGTMAEKAKRLYAKVDGRSALLPPGVSLELSAGMMHDSNVALYPDDQLLPATLGGGDDNRWQLGMDLRWRPLLDNEAPLTLGYRLFHSRHQHLDEFDLLNHSLLVDWHQKRAGLEWGVNYQYINASLDGYDYVATHLLTPNLMLFHGDKRLSFIKLQWRGDRYDYPGLEGYDGSRYELGYSHFWLLGGQRYLSAGAIALRNDTDDESLSHSGYGVNGAAEWEWQTMLTRVALDYQRKRFPDASGGERSDNVLKLDLRLLYPLSKQLQVQVDGSRIDNRSDAAAYDYDRTLYGMTLKWML